ncbi:asparagine synthase-related protein [soil metagenome]
MYVCALRPHGEPLSKMDVFGYIARLKRRPDASLHSVVEGPFAAVATEHPSQPRPQLGRWRNVIGAGDVRLDNRAEVARIGGVDPADVASDLTLVLAALDRAGEGCIARLLGDYAFVAWDARAQKLLAVRDAFGVKPLYHRVGQGLVLFSSEIAPLQTDESYDIDYIADDLSGHPAPATHTIGRGISAVAAGSIVRQRGTVQTHERCWAPETFVPAEHGDERENAVRFRELLEEGVRTRMTGAGDVWAQLSGGLDSSSIVSIASSGQYGGGKLAGTVTIVDSMGEGDERAYSNVVAERFGLRNEQVCDYWAWQEDGSGAPATDHPYPMLPFHARDQRVHDSVHDAGGRVRLSGMGADHYLTGTLDYITDLASAGQVRDALREVTNWSVATRQSFWRLGRRYLLDPFLNPDGRSAATSPSWLAADLRGRVSAGVSADFAAHRLRTGQRFAGRVAAGLHALPSWIERWPYGEQVEMRYPFLYRPLVEWSLQLPARQRAWPHAQKWILREAMRGLLPDEIRTRTTKGAIAARILWSMRHEKARLDHMLKDPILAQIGCIDGAALRDAVDRAVRGVPVHNVHLFSALSLETWLSARAAVSWSSQAMAAASAA